MNETVASPSSPAQVSNNRAEAVASIADADILTTVESMASQPFASVAVTT